MENGTLFSEMRLNGKPLKDCDMAIECNGNNYRLYVDRAQERNTFYSLAVEFVSCVSDGDIWECPELRVEPIFNSTAYFDGVRHLEFNREAGDMAGYIYCPNIQGVVDLFSKLREIELEVCRECDK